MIVQEQVQAKALHTLDATAALTAGAAIMEWVPVVAGLFTIVWLSLRIWVLADERIAKIRGNK